MAMGVRLSLSSFAYVATVFRAAETLNAEQAAQQLSAANERTTLDTLGAPHPFHILKFNMQISYSISANSLES